MLILNFSLTSISSKASSNVMAMEIRCRIPEAHELPVLCVAFNNYRNEVYSGSQDCFIKIWDVESGSQIRVQEGHQAWVTDLLYSDLVKILFSCSLDGKILAWSDKGKLLQVVEFGGPVYCLAWDVKGKHIVAGGKGVVQLYRVIRSSASVYIKSGSQNQKMGTVKFMQPSTFTYIHKNMVQGVCCSHLGNVFTAGHDGCVCLFESNKPGTTMMRLAECHEGAISAVAYDKDAKTLITGSYDGSIKIWSHEGHCLDEFINVTDSVTSIAYIPATKCLWVAGKENYPVIIDTLAPANVTEWVADTCGIRKLPLTKVYHASEKDIAIGVSRGLEIIIWRFNRFGPHRVLQGHTDWLECLVIAYRKPPKIAEDEAVQEPKTKKRPSAASPSKRVTFTGGNEAASPASSPEPEVTVKKHKRPLPTGQPGSLLDTEVYSAGADGSILKWKPSPGNNCDSWTLHEYAPPSRSAILCMIHDSILDVLVTGSEDCKIRIWNLDAQPSVSRSKSGGGESTGPDVLRGHEDKVVGVCVHNQELLISASYDKTLRWWNLALRLPMDVIEMAHDLPIEHMEYSAYRGEIATCGGGNFFKIWDASKKKLLTVMTGGSGNITIIKWCNSGDGLWVTASDQGEVAMWDPATGCQTKSMCQTKQPVTFLFVDETNKLMLMSMLSDHLIRGYDMNLEKEICTYIGHTDQVHSLVYFPHRKQYLSGSWDSTIRAWLVPDARMEPKPVVLMKANSADEDKEVDPLQEEPLISSYEKEYPLVPPKTLQSIGPTIFPSKRPDSRESAAPVTSLLSPGSRTTTSSTSSSDSRSQLTLSKRLEDLDMILKPPI